MAEQEKQADQVLLPGTAEETASVAHHRTVALPPDPLGCSGEWPGQVTTSSAIPGEVLHGHRRGSEAAVRARSGRMGVP